MNKPCFGNMSCFGEQVKCFECGRGHRFIMIDGVGMRCLRWNMDWKNCLYSMIDYG